jgi:hypothetical protein
VNNVVVVRHVDDVDIGGGGGGGVRFGDGGGALCHYRGLSVHHVVIVLKKINKVYKKERKI